MGFPLGGNLLIDLFCEQSLLFQALKALELSKATRFVKRSQWVDFHQAVRSQNEQSLLFQLFKLWAFKSLQFCQKRSMSTFSPSGKLKKWAKFAFSSFYKRSQWVDSHQASRPQKQHWVNFLGCIWWVEKYYKNVAFLNVEYSWKMWVQQIGIVWNVKLSLSQERTNVKKQVLTKLNASNFGVFW